LAELLNSCSCFSRSAFSPLVYKCQRQQGVSKLELFYQSDVISKEMQHPIISISVNFQLGTMPRR
jgi:hypothetical protein